MALFETIRPVYDGKMLGKKGWKMGRHKSC